MTIHYQFDEISFTPFKKEAAGYSWSFFKQDAFAALSVALLTIPQAMAYALLAGLPVSCGLFAAIFASFVSPAFGSSRHLVSGPSTALAILVQAGTSEVLYTYYRHLTGEEWSIMAVQILTQLVLLTSILQILAAIGKLGRLIQFVSYSVIIGYVAGTATAITINQLYTLLGLEQMTGVHSFYERAAYLVTHIHQAHLPTVLIGLGSFFTILSLKRLDKRIPAAVVTFVLAAAVVWYCDLSSYETAENTPDPYAEEEIPRVMLIGDSGSVSDMMPKLSLPYFDTGIMNELLPIAFALALLSIMETASAAKSLAASSGQRLSVNQEILGIGLGNMASSFLGGLPISGGPMRSFVNFHNGAQTRFAAMMSSMFVGLLVYTCGSLMSAIPLASLAALLIISSANIVNPRHFFLCLKATNSDASVLWITLLSCIFFSLDVAFYIGVVLSIILYLKKAAMPQLVECDIDDSGELVNLTFCNVPEHKSIRVIKVEGELFFGAADLFQTTLKAFAEDDTSTKVIVLQLKNTRDIDATACLALQQLHDYLKMSGRQLVACGITTQIWEVLSNSGLVELMGKEHLFLFDERHPHMHMQKAIYHAKRLVAYQPAVESLISQEPSAPDPQEQSVTV